MQCTVVSAESFYALPAVEELSDFIVSFSVAQSWSCRQQYVLHH